MTPFSLIADNTKISVTTLIDQYMLQTLDTLQSALGAATDLYVDDAKALCGIMMLFYLSLQAYTLLTGDGKVSLIPLLRPFIFFLIVVNWNGFIYTMDSPLHSIDSQAKGAFTEVRKGINERYAVRQEKQDELVNAVFNSTQKLADSESTIDQGGNKILQYIGIDGLEEMLNVLSNINMKLQSRIQTFIQKTVEYVMMLFFKACIYFLYFIRILLQTILRILGPFVFALSIIGAYRDLYLQWISKYVSLGLYGAIAHISIMLAFILISLGIDTDIAFLDQTIATYNKGASIQGKAVVIHLFTSPNAGGSSLIIALVTGIFGLLMTPIISTWVLGANSTTQVANKALAGTGKLLKGK